MTGVVDPMRVYFAIRLARVDLPGALEQVAKIRGKEQAREALENIAGNLAATSPADSERVLGMIDRGINRSIALMRICQRMAPVDPPRAQRLAMTAQGDEFRVKVLMFLALGQKEKDRNAAITTFRDGLRLLDRPAESGEGVMRSWEIPGLALIAEQIDPALVPEIFWRALAARSPCGDPRQGDDGALTVMAMCLSRYDREVGAAVLEPTAVEMEQVKEGSASRSIDFLAIAVVDPRRAGSLIDRIPVTSDLSVNSNWSRIRLAEMLASPPEARWKAIWRSSSSVAGILFSRDMQ